MSEKHSSKKLITAIVGLVLSFATCVATCVAWFFTNERVNSNGIHASVNTDDVIRFDVNVYYLDNKLSEDGKNTFLGYNKSTYQGKTGNVSSNLYVKEEGGSEYQYPVDDKSDGELTSDNDAMRPYGVLGGKFATAVLIEIDLEIRPNDNYYRIYASNSTDALEVEEPSGAEDIYTSMLSNVVGFDKAEGNGFDGKKDSGLFNKTIAIGNFYDSDNNKILTKVLQNNIHPSAQNGETENYVAKLYFIMDYIDESFPRLSSKMLEAGGTLNSRLRFLGDITISLETYDPDNETAPKAPATGNI